MRTIRIGEGDIERISNLPQAHSVKEAISLALRAYEDGEIFTPFGEMYRWGRGEVGMGHPHGGHLLSPKGLMMHLCHGDWQTALSHLRMAEQRLFGDIPFDTISHEQVMEALRLAATLPVRVIQMDRRYRTKASLGTMYSPNSAPQQAMPPHSTQQWASIEGAFEAAIIGSTNVGQEAP